MLVLGLPAFLAAPFIQDRMAYLVGLVFCCTGIGLVAKKRFGLYFVYGFCILLTYASIGESGPILLLHLTVLSFFVIPGGLYYPKRWDEFAAGLGRSTVGPSQPEKSSQPTRPTTLLPDLDKHLAAKGTPQTMLIFTSWEMDTLQVSGSGQYCTTRVQPSEGRLYCATFDFDNSILTDLMHAATERTQDFIAEKLIDDPFSVRSMVLPDPISVGVAATLGDLQQGLHDLFIPLVIAEVFGAAKH